MCKTCFTALQEVQDDLCQVMKLRRAGPEFQLSVYPPNGAQYVRHRDAFPDDGSDEHQRKARLQPLLRTTSAGFAAARDWVKGGLSV